VDSLPYPVFRKAAFVAVGGYDETMTRNQDNDMNYRLRKAGYKLYCTWKTSCEYRTRPNFRALLNYASSNASWCGISLRKKPRSLRLRHYVPFLFVISTLLGLAMLPVAAAYLPLMIFLLPVPLHLSIGHLAALRLMVRERNPWAFLLPWVLLAFHITYGSAFFVGIFKFPRIAFKPEGFTHPNRVSPLS